MASVIDTHPQRDQIVEAILARKPLREVAKLAGISHTAVGDYVRKVIKPSVLSVRVASNLSEDQPVSTEVIQQTRETVTAAKSAAACAPIIAKLANRVSRREALIAKAAEVNDFRGFASLDNCEYKDIELECRLTGLLDNQQLNQQTTIVNLVCGTVSITAEPATGEELQCIDIASQRIEE